MVISSMNSRPVNSNSGSFSTHNNGYAGQPWLAEERDACGVGFIADQKGRSSHDLLEKSLVALGCMEHRGGCSADQDSGDGAGIMTALPWAILQGWGSENGQAIASESTAVGMAFLPQDAGAAKLARDISEAQAIEHGMAVLGWRSVPVKPETLGIQARENQPQIEQLILSSDGKTGDELERSLYHLRKRIEKVTAEKFPTAGFAAQVSEFYFCSLSSRTIIYKGMVRSEVLGQFYGDLANPAYETPFAVYHRRFSTNTLPKWPLAQPMRLLGHNGEINTQLGNLNWMTARQYDLAHDCWGDQMDDLIPVINYNNSDSANLDNTLELLVRSGRSPIESLMIMVPEAYRDQPDLTQYPEITDFYEYYSGLQEPWDGPALLAFSDGKVVGATLDRNGLRPARYSITRDGYIVVGSETGAVEVPAADVIEKGRLGPGQMIAFDLERCEILKNWETKQKVAAAKPYGQWMQQQQVDIKPQAFGSEKLLSSDELLRKQTAFGYTAEDVEMIIDSMAEMGKEPTYCMGDDIPLAVLSNKARLLYDYFKQRFAQVTNPPIDPLREKLVMSLEMKLGQRNNILEVGEADAKLLHIQSPILNDAELNEIRESGFGVETLPTLYALADGPSGLGKAVTALCEKAEAAVKAGQQVLILSDRANDGVAESTTYIPPLLATGAVHHHLIKTGLRMRASIIADTAQCWSTHHYACLVGYGATAVCPYLTLESVRHWWDKPKTKTAREKGTLNVSNLEAAQYNYKKSIEAGLLKILSKMGISLLGSYQGAQIFEAIGIGGDLLETGFRGTTSRMGGMTLSDLAEETVMLHARAFPELGGKRLTNFGFVRFIPKGEYHMNSGPMAKALHKALENPDRYDHYEAYKRHLQERPPTALRDLLLFEGDREPIDISEVESAADIVKRFCTGGMSLGSLSREAHETLAVAMNRIGGKSNSGEGGEDIARFKVLDDVDGDGNSNHLPHLNGLRNGDTASSAIKQIASGRFGVTPEYLMAAKQLEIKMAQGAKPGEGGQLPGIKVSEYIAMLRNSKPGVTLISPPPHHDIYSIEDLAQLIYDLHQINAAAKVSVKLVAEIGIGTIAAGVAKANADVIQISGHDGGTGASPLSSIKHAGGPWELGLTEVHRALIKNGLRDRVLLRADGGLKTGWDVIMAALMGAEEYGFGSIAMIAEGCIMARVCHMNSCPVGVATQREDLRKRFPGIPEKVVNFFLFVAEETRQLLAKLGYRSLNDIIGRADLLSPRTDVELSKTGMLNLDCLTTEMPDTKSDRAWLDHGEVNTNGPVLDDEILADSEIKAAINHQSEVSKTFKIVNTDRSVGARISGTIAKQYGNLGFGGQLNLTYEGSAGQSFGAFHLAGMTTTLIGESNDYVGKGMNGGAIVIKPFADAAYSAADNVIIGNTCLYGATGGTLFANGRAGERFAVRNSKGHAVVEGTGDHCCEYMTGGVVVVLGRVGRNVGAGMTGGLGYFLDEDGTFQTKVNPEIVKVQRVIAPAGQAQLKDLIERHYQHTGSPKAKELLDNWSDSLTKFWQVVPPSEADLEFANADAAKVAASA